MTEYKGHCVCGSVTFSFHTKTPEIQTAICHCDTCQRLGGSPYGFFVGTTKDDLTINGPYNKYIAKSESGKNSFKYFCSKCGSNIAREHESMAPTIFVCAGTIDAESKAKLQAPGLEVWTKNKLPFITLSAPISKSGNP